MLFFQPACPLLLVNVHVTPPEGPGPKPSSHRSQPGNPKSRIILLLHSHRNPSNQSIISHITFSLSLGISNTCNSGERWKKKVSMTSENLPPSLSIRFIWVLLSNKDEANTRDAGRIIFKEYESKWGKNEVSKEPREPRQGLFLVTEESLTEKALQEWRTENRKQTRERGMGTSTAVSLLLLLLLLLLFHTRHYGKSEILILNICPCLSLQNSYAPIPPSKTLLKYHGLPEASVSLLPSHSL